MESVNATTQQPTIRVESPLNVFFDDDANLDEAARKLNAERPDSFLVDEQRYSEVGLAQDFATKHAGDLIFIADWKRWLKWDGQRFRDDSGMGVMQLAKSYAESLWGEVGSLYKHMRSEEFEKAAGFVKSTQSLRKIQAFVKLAESDQKLVVSHGDLNQLPEMLNVRNGTIHLPTGELRPHSTNDLITQLAPVDFEQTALCVEWDKTLSLVFGGQLELIRYFRQVMGYALHGAAPEAILPIWHGDGNNGKSTIWNALYALLGDYAGTASQELILPLRDQHPTERADLFAKRFVMVAETDEARRLAESQVKMLTGNDRIKCRRMNENFWEFSPSHLLNICSNHRPKVTGKDAGIWRRIKLIPFEVDLSKVVKRRSGFHEWLVKHEGPGILNWLIAGYQDWKANGFIEPDVVRDATAEYRSNEDDVGQFLQNRCVLATESFEYGADLFKAYQMEGGRMTLAKFGRELKSQLEHERRRGGVVYLGVSLDGGDS